MPVRVDPIRTGLRQGHQQQQYQRQL
jgi:hypothetical protein